MKNMENKFIKPLAGKEYSFVRFEGRSMDGHDRIPCALWVNNKSFDGRCDGTSQNRKGKCRCKCHKHE